MSDTNMQVVRRLLEQVWSKGDLSVLPEIMATDFVGHAAPYGATLQGIEQYQQRIAVFKGIFPEIIFTIEDQFASGDKVATRWTARVRESLDTATRDQATGEPISVSGISIQRLQDGKVVESWENWDAMTVLESSDAPNLLDSLSFGI